MLTRQTNTGGDQRTSGIRRYPISSHRTSYVHVIPFGQMVRVEHVVRIADFSIVGVGIESEENIDPGLVCFDEPVSGHKFGIITWCKQHGEGYRAGISFVRIGHDHAEYILSQISQAAGRHSLFDPEKIIETLLKSLKQGTSQ